MNSFGYGGTNAHAILDGYDRANIHSNGSATNRDELLDSVETQDGTSTLSGTNHRARVFLLSHRTKTGVLRLAQTVRDYLTEKRSVAERSFLDDLAHTLASHRTKFNWRLGATAASRAELLDVLTPQQIEPKRTISNPRIGFIFTGQGAQWYAMGIELVDRYKVFKTTLLSADAHYKTLGASWSILGNVNDLIGLACWR